MKSTRSYPYLGQGRVRFAAVVLAAVWTIGGSGASWVRADAPTPPEMPPDAVAKVTELLKKSAVLKRKQLDGPVQAEIAAAVRDAGLNPDEKNALEAVAAKAEDVALDDFTVQCLREFREAYARDGAGSLDRVGKPGAENFIAGPTGPTGKGVHFTGPLDQPAWKDGIAQALTPEQLALWRKAQADREAAMAKEVAAYLDAQTGAWRERAEEPMHIQTQEIIAVLALPKARADQIDALARRAVDASLEAWRQTVREYFLKNFAGKPPEERAKFLKGQGFFMNSMNGDMPEKQAVWTDGLTKLLTDDDRARLQAARENHKTRRVHALGQLIVAVLDEKAAFTGSQRQQLEPILERLAPSQAEFFPNTTNGNYYYSLQTQSFYKAAAKAKPEELHPILDDLQWKHWQAFEHADDTEDDDEAVSQQQAAPTPTGQAASAGEPEDMEQVVSDYLQTRAAAHYRQVENVMVLQAEDATRVAGLAATHAARLQTAARGSAEAAVAAWEPAVEQNTRAEVQNATPENIRQKLGNGSRYWYDRTDPREDALWKAAVNEEMTPPQQAAWTAERNARSQYRDAAVVGFLLAEFDRKFSLLPDQWDKLAPAVAKALQDYQPDFQGMFSYSNSRWYLMSYYMFLPLHAVPENEIKPLLSREQWERWTGSREFSISANYWENIRQNHNARVQQKAP